MGQLPGQRLAVEVRALAGVNADVVRRGEQSGELVGLAGPELLVLRRGDQQRGADLRGDVAELVGAHRRVEVVGVGDAVGAGAEGVLAGLVGVLASICVMIASNCCFWPLSSMSTIACGRWASHEVETSTTPGSAQAATKRCSNASARGSQ